ncbi:MAG: 3-hydroxybutyryl-CoA dehydrogenase [Thermoleophilia bacterium]
MARLATTNEDGPERMSESTAGRIATVGVVGLGTMGGGIAQICAQAGFTVVGRELDHALAERGRARIDDQLGRAVARGKLSQEEKDATMARLSATADLADLADCDIVIEAALEEIETKRELFAALEAVVRPDAILATNTSALSVTEIAAATSSPQRIVGLHFFNPAPVLPLVEVVRTALVDEDVYEAAFAFAQAIGKQPIRCNDTPGFVVNRILIPVLNDAVRVLDEAGVTPEDVDLAMKGGCAWPIGPCALIDLIGVDVQVHASEALFEAFREPRMAPPPRLVRMVKAGHLGRKTGQGFFTY